MTTGRNTIIIIRLGQYAEDLYHRLMSSTETSVIIATFFVSLLWSFTIPVWHFPDEQAHFAEIQDYAELKTVPRGKDLSLEIYESERLLGTLRDGQGRNKYTPTPGYQLPLSQTRYGYDELYLASMAPELRTTMVGTEAPHYPPLYYVIGSFAYQQVISGSIFDRLFVVRFVSVLLMTCLSYASLLVGRELFPRRKQLLLATMIMTSLAPMMIFVGSGVNNDILMDLVCTLLIAKSLMIIRRPINRYDLLHFCLLVIAGFLTKQLVYLFIPGMIAAIGYSWYRYHWNKKGLIAMGIGGVVIVIAYLLVKRFNQGFWMPYWPAIPSIQSFLPALWMVLLRTYRETLAWYWGVYHWLGLVSPLWILRLIKLLMGVSIVGSIWYAWKHKTEWKKETHRPWIWAIGQNLLYIGALIAWEATNVARMGFGHGLQGRYFFPLISLHMAILLAGWWSLGVKKIARWIPTLIATIFSGFNLFMLWYVLGSYYHKSPISQFVIELSQYKPEIAKWPTILIPALLAIGSILIMIISTIKESHRETEV